LAHVNVDKRGGKDFISVSRVKVRAAFIRTFLPWRAVGISGRGWRHNLAFLFTSAASPHVASLSVAMGVFMGITPFYGFQVIILAALTPVLRLHWPLAFVGVNVSCVPLFPFVFAASVAVGKIVVPRLPFTVPSIIWANVFAKYGVAWFVGSVVLAICAGILAYGLSYPVFWRLAKRKKVD
jgi:uncharacterized protein (DUF2062 family)